MRAVGDCCIRKIRDGEGERKEKTKKECDGKRRIFYGPGYPTAGRKTSIRYGLPIFGKTTNGNICTFLIRPAHVVPATRSKLGGGDSRGPSSTWLVLAAKESLVPTPSTPVSRRNKKLSCGPRFLDETPAPVLPGAASPWRDDGNKANLLKNRWRKGDWFNRKSREKSIRQKKGTYARKLLCLVCSIDLNRSAYIWIGEQISY